MRSISLEPDWKNGIYHCSNVGNTASQYAAAVSHKFWPASRIEQRNLSYYNHIGYLEQRSSQKKNKGRTKRRQSTKENRRLRPDLKRWK
jgi:hypothetical protein